MEKNQNLKVLLVGTGKTGSIIKQIAPKYNVKIIKESNKMELQGDFECDVIIDFTSPTAFLENIETLVKKHRPLVVGTTGWYEEIEKVRTLVEAHDIGFIYASNFSIGVNIFFELNRLLAELMKNYSEYDCSVYEVHHRNKKDAPSGTAKTLIKDLLEILSYKKYVQFPRDYEQNKPDVSALTVSYSRYGNVRGIHSVIYSSDYDEIKITHNAYSREGFAVGAIKAAHWIKDKKGFYNFNKIWKEILK